ncbi:MAG TPA: ATP12 family protein [Micropepsaceae bacterium]|nr:ATP12 family protein [Micropepsaceae bacterium]
MIKRPKRFYKTVQIDELASGHWQVRLDGWGAKTPAGNALDLPTRALAGAIAAEWDAQTGEIRPETMSLTRLANAAIDRIAAQRQTAVEELMRFAANDLLCFRAPAPERLVEVEAAAWDPLLEWLADEYGVLLRTGTCIAAVQQDPDDLGTLESFLLRFDEFSLAGIVAAAQLLGSAVLALALFERRIDPDQAIAAAEVDSAYQQRVWGEDPLLVSRNAKRLFELSVIAQFFGFARAV